MRTAGSLKAEDVCFPFLNWWNSFNTPRVARMVNSADTPEEYICSMRKILTQARSHWRFYLLSQEFRVEEA